MREKAVCNASPLIFLAKIQKLRLLDYYELYIPTHVETEIGRGLKSKKEDAKQIIEYLKNSHIKPATIKPQKDLPDFLGPGEKDVLNFAIGDS